MEVLHASNPDTQMLEKMETQAVLDMVADPLNLNLHFFLSMYSKNMTPNRSENTKLDFFFLTKENTKLD